MITNINESEMNEAKSKLIELIRTLEERDRLIITMYYYEQLSYKEISESIGIPVSHISKIHSKILKIVKDSLGYELRVDNNK